MQEIVGGYVWRWVCLEVGMSGGGYVWFTVNRSWEIPRNCKRLQLGLVLTDIGRSPDQISDPKFWDIRFFVIRISAHLSLGEWRWVCLVQV